jgi:hypothetical protein
MRTEKDCNKKCELESKHGLDRRRGRRSRRLKWKLKGEAYHCQLSFKTPFRNLDVLLDDCDLRFDPQAETGRFRTARFSESWEVGKIDVLDRCMG